MKINYQWLKEFVDVDLSPRLLASQLTMAGLAVDSVDEIYETSVLDLDVTSNRPDCLSHLGVAREVAALTGQLLHVPPVKLVEADRRAEDAALVTVEDRALCARYTARVITGVTIGPSPPWVVAKLESVGQRSINNVADITNLVLLESGQPLHAFDFDKLAGHRIIVRRARPGERLVTLDGVERDLFPSMLVIADAERAVALAGIMGGADSEISDGTTNVLLESASFSAASVRQTARALGLNTEASYRFERGTDREAAALASDRAGVLIVELAGGELLGGIFDVRTHPLESPQIPFRKQRYRDLTGLETSLADAAKTLRGLGLTVVEDATGESLNATAPSWRNDLSIEEDLIEEVARISGYDRIRATLPGGAGAGDYLRGERERRTVRRTLAGLGFHEAISFSFVSAQSDLVLSQAPPEARLYLQNPIDETQSQMRTTVLVGLVEALERNLNRGNRNVRLFEIGECFEEAGRERPRETERLGLIATGVRNENDWQRAAEWIDFFDVKGAIETIGESLGKKTLGFTASEAIGYLHPGRAAVISLDGKDVGCLGQLHPRVAALYKFKQPVYVADVDFTALVGSEELEVRYRVLPRFPMVVRDLSLLLDEQVLFADVERAISELAISELTSVRLFDLYIGQELPAGKRSISLTLRFRADDRTLTDSEIGSWHSRIVSSLAETFAAEIR